MAKDDPSLLLALPLPVLLARAQKLREERLRGGANTGRVARRIALLSGFNTQFLTRMLELFLAEAGVEATIYEAPYASLFENVLNPESDLYRFAPDLTVLLPHPREIGSGPPELFANANEVARLVEEAAKRWADLWRVVLSRASTQIIQANFVLPPRRALGNLEGSLSFGTLAFVRAVNQALVEKRTASVHVLDLEYLTNAFGLERALDMRNYYVSKQLFSFDFLPRLCLALTRQIALHSGLARKCAVLDLDGTLWGGTVGEDGPDQIVLGPDSAEGEAFQDFQRYLLQLKSRGVLLAVCSKNDPDNARAPFDRNPHMLLKFEDIACFVANWSDKAENVVTIAQTLNIGLDALVFIDNSPEERHRVREALPDVHVLELPEDPADYADALDAGALFEVSELTVEATARTASFTEERLRSDTQSNFADYDSYLQSLNLKAVVGPIDDACMGRVCELIKRTNQFNLRTVRHSEAELRRLLLCPENVGFQVSIADRFGSYGLVSVLIMTRDADAFFVDTWLMSCRVLKKGVEQLVLARVLREARARGARRILGEYRPTTKNGMVRDLYPRLGFQLLDDSDERSLYELPTEGDLPPRLHFIEEKDSGSP